MAFIHPDTLPFHHPEIIWLYEEGLRIEATKLQTILSLPRPTLVQDLEKILADTREHATYYENLQDEELEDGFQGAPLHAMMLLGELQSKESLPAILDWLSGSEDFLESWLGDHITETIWDSVYKLLPNDWELLEAFLKNPDVNMFARNVVTQALNQLTLQQPEYRATVVSLYERMLTYYQLHPSTAETDDFTSMMVGEAFEIQAKELIPKIAALHDTMQLDEMMAGRKEDIVSDMEQEPVIRTVMPITERYQKIVTTWAGYKEEEEESADEELEDEMEDYADWEPWQDDDDDEPELLPIRTEPKIGRNDPCPCGSGKKYKKCHMNA